MLLSRNFPLDEALESQEAERKGIDNTPTPEVIENLKFLFTNLVQPIRDKWGITIISSGYRSPELNRSIGGSLTSQHVMGQAADLKFTGGVDKLQVAKWIIAEKLPFDQLILEAYDPANVSKGWLHVSLTKGFNRKQVMTATFKGGKVQYSVGLPV